MFAPRVLSASRPASSPDPLYPTPTLTPAPTPTRALTLTLSLTSCSSPLLSQSRPGRGEPDGVLQRAAHGILQLPTTVGPAAPWPAAHRPASTRWASTRWAAKARWRRREDGGEGAHASLVEHHPLYTNADLLSVRLYLPCGSTNYGSTHYGSAHSGYTYEGTHAAGAQAARPALPGKERGAGRECDARVGNGPCSPRIIYTSPVYVSPEYNILPQYTSARSTYFVHARLDRFEIPLRYIRPLYEALAHTCDGYTLIPGGLGHLDQPRVHGRREQG